MQQLSKQPFNRDTVKLKRIGLLPRILIAIVLGIGLGLCLPMPLVRLFVTFNGVFGQLLKFMVPFIILGLVTPAIGGIGRSAGKLLLTTVLIAYVDTILSGLLAYGTGSVFFPALVAGGVSGTESAMAASEAIAPYFEINIPAMFDVMSALVLSFIVGLCIAYIELPTLRGIAIEFRVVVSKAISKLIIPLLPLYIFGIFLEMTVSGQVWRIVSVFAWVIAIIFVLHVFILVYQYLIAGLVAKKNPFRLLYNMLPAYMTALGTSSSAATERGRLLHPPLCHHPPVGFGHEDHGLRADHLPA